MKMMREDMKQQMFSIEHAQKVTQKQLGGIDTVSL
jgi:hypothetical protein